MIYVQWYPYKFNSGYVIINPTEEALEDFYENVRASDPNHESFVLKLSNEWFSCCNMMGLNEYIFKSEILNFFTKMPVQISYSEKK